MYISERMAFLEKLTFKKQLAFAILSSERAYREADKFYQKFIIEKTKFREILDELWRFLRNESPLTKEEWRNLGLEIEDLFEKKNNYYYQNPLNELANVLKMSMGMIIWGDATHQTAAGTSEKPGEIIGDIYDDQSSKIVSETIIWYKKEIIWLEKALYLIAESNEMPTNYEWFSKRISEYERGEISTNFRKSYKKYAESQENL